MPLFGATTTRGTCWQRQDVIAKNTFSPLAYIAANASNLPCLKSLSSRSCHPYPCLPLGEHQVMLNCLTRNANAHDVGNGVCARISRAFGASLVPAHSASQLRREFAGSPLARSVLPDVRRHCTNVDVLGKLLSSVLMSFEAFANCAVPTRYRGRAGSPALLPAHVPGEPTATLPNSRHHFYGIS